MGFKALATDVDRTLTDDDLLLDLQAVRTIRLLEEAGVRVILLSGRDLATVGSLALYLGACGLVAAEDGALVGSLGGAFGFSLRMMADVGRVRAGLAALKEAFGAKVREYHIPARVASLVLSRELDLAAANDLLARRGVPAKVVDSGLACELCDADVDKGRGLIEAAASLGVDPADVAAVGDNFNDVEMFEAAGWSAAVANAPEDVKARADYVCRHPYGRGFVEAVRRAVELFRPDLAGLPWPDPEAVEEPGAGLPPEKERAARTESAGPRRAFGGRAAGGAET